MANASKENGFYDFRDSLLCCQAEQEFIAKIENFIIHKLPMNRILNLNSLFTEERQPKWRDKFIKVMTEKILPTQNFVDFCVEINPDWAEWESKKNKGELLITDKEPAFKFRKINNIFNNGINFNSEKGDN